MKKFIGLLILTIAITIAGWSQNESPVTSAIRFDTQAKTVEVYGLITLDKLYEVVTTAEVNGLEGFFIKPTFPVVYAMPGQSWYHKLVVKGKYKFVELYGDVTVKAFVDKFALTMEAYKGAYISPTSRDCPVYNTKDLYYLLIQ